MYYAKNLFLFIHVYLVCLFELPMLAIFAKKKKTQKKRKEGGAKKRQRPPQTSTLL